MKIRYPVIGAIIILIIVVGFENILEPEVSSVLGILFLVSLGLIVYLIIRNIIRAIKGAATGIPKQKQDTAPPWEK